MFSFNAIGASFYTTDIHIISSNDHGA